MAADKGSFLRARATYTDMTSDPDNPVSVLVDERTQGGDGTPNGAATVKAAGIVPDGTTDGDEDNPTTFTLYRVQVVSAKALCASSLAIPRQ